jgi:hypothetical protein
MQSQQGYLCTTWLFSPQLSRRRIFISVLHRQTKLISVPHDPMISQAGPQMAGQPASQSSVSGAHEKITASIPPSEPGSSKGSKQVPNYSSYKDYLDRNVKA